MSDRKGSHFVIFYTEPNQREIAELAASKMKNCYVRDIRHGGDKRSRRGEVLISFRRDLGKWAYAGQSDELLLIMTFDQWIANQNNPYLSHNDWVESIADIIVSELSK